MDFQSLLDKALQPLITTALLSFFAIYLKSRVDKKFESFKQDLIERTQIRKVLIDKEIAFYQELSEAFTTIVDGCKYFLLVVFSNDPNESGIDREKRELRPVEEAYNTVYDLTGAHQFFYPEHLYDRLDHFLSLLSRHIRRHKNIIGDMVRENRSNLARHGIGGSFV